MTQSFLYSVEREYPVSIERLWRAWTDASELEAWYHPTDLQSTKGATISELQIGGLWKCGVDVPAENFVAYFFGKYTKIVPNQLLEHSLYFTTSAAEFDAQDFSSPSHRIVIEFQNRGSNSWSKFSQYGELPDGEEKRAQAGMNSYLESLAHFLTT